MDSKLKDASSKLKSELFKLLSALFVLFFQPYLIMLLWNSVLIDLFEVKNIGYWQAFAVMWLGQTIFSRYYVRATINDGK